MKSFPCFVFVNVLFIFISLVYLCFLEKIFVFIVIKYCDKFLKLFWCPKFNIFFVYHLGFLIFSLGVLIKDFLQLPNQRCLLHKTYLIYV
ncbi:hypothetical protein KU48_15535 [Bacillus safensis]|nr:hypothetical protein KU48_15535 [Bacillus safensis]